MKSTLAVLLIIVGVSHAQTWTQKQDFPSTAIEAGVMVYLGNKLYVGLGGNNTFYNDWYEYYIPSNTWSTKASFPGQARFAPAYFELNGKIYVGCGVNSGFTSALSDFYCYDPSNNTWSAIANFGG